MLIAGPLTPFFQFATRMLATRLITCSTTTTIPVPRWETKRSPLEKMASPRERASAVEDR